MAQFFIWSANVGEDSEQSAKMLLIPAQLVGILRSTRGINRAGRVGLIASVAFITVNRQL